MNKSDESHIAKATPEVWGLVTGYGGNYKISNIGRVFSVKRGIIMKQQIDRYGYPYVKLCLNNSKKHHTIHRLVVQAFIPNPDNLPHVNHINEIKSHNYVSNLEWCTCAQNIEHSHAKSYEVLTPDGMLLEIFNLSKFCRENNLNQGHMSEVSANKRSHCKGYRIWEIPDAKVPTGSI